MVRYPPAGGDLARSCYNWRIEDDIAYGVATIGLPTLGVALESLIKQRA
jgi:hypothetical protein